MARDKPGDRHALSLVTGVGQVKLERYGDAFLDVVARFA
jgi:ATP-dependent DNA helicase RecQ